MMVRGFAHPPGDSGHRLPIRRIAQAAIALAVALPATAALAQSSSAHIGPGPAGAKVGARNDTGAHRSTTIRDNARHDLRTLPMGTYAVTLTEAGVVIDTRRNIPLMAGRGAEVDFACPGDHGEAGAPKLP